MEKGFKHFHPGASDEEFKSRTGVQDPISDLGTKEYEPKVCPYGDYVERRMALDYFVNEIAVGLDPAQFPSGPGEWTLTKAIRSLTSAPASPATTNLRISKLRAYAKTNGLLVDTPQIGNGQIHPDLILLQEYLAANPWKGSQGRDLRGSNGKYGKRKADSDNEDQDEQPKAKKSKLDGPELDTDSMMVDSNDGDDDEQSIAAPEEVPRTRSAARGLKRRVVQDSEDEDEPPAKKAKAARASDEEEAFAISSEDDSPYEEPRARKKRVSKTRSQSRKK